jgi:hypothetical protein
MYTVVEWHIVDMGNYRLRDGVLNTKCRDQESNQKDHPHSRYKQKKKKDRRGGRTVEKSPTFMQEIRSKIEEKSKRKSKRLCIEITCHRAARTR